MLRIKLNGKDTIDFIIQSTGNAVDFGNMSATIDQVVSNSTRGLFVGGSGPFTLLP